MIRRSPKPESGTSDRASRREAIAALPMQMLTPAARTTVSGIVNKPTLYRRLPVQDIACDADLFVYLTRHPEVLVGMWDVMDITNVQIERTGPYQLRAVDGSGTTCSIDLIYGDRNIHIYVAHGVYDGPLNPKPIRGNGVFVVRSTFNGGAGGTRVRGTLDCFLQLESLGADLIARTFGGLIGRSADHNFRETAKFIAQVSEASSLHPDAMIDLALRLPQVTPEVRRGYAGVITAMPRRTASGPRERDGNWQQR